MKPEDLKEGDAVLWTPREGVTPVSSRFIEHVPPQAPIREGATAYPGAEGLRPRCKIEELSTGKQLEVWVDDLSETPN